MRPTSLLRRALHSPPVSHSTQPTPLVYSLGLSYAGKASPPFVPPTSHPAKYGFKGDNSRVGRWVDEMMMLRAGRGELVGGEGGWDTKMQDEVRKWGAGEDFFAVVDDGGYTHLAVSDGVGGWAPQVDPSLFSQALMHRYATSAVSSPSSAPWDVLKKAFEGVMAEDKVQAGSATAVGINLSGNGDLRGVNLGDSGMTLLRNNQIWYTTPVQTHYFNCPLQLTKAPLGMDADLAKDKPEDGFQFRMNLEPGDAVILYTDGLSDNLPPSHLPLLANRISQLLAQPANAHLSPQDRADEKARLLADVLLGYGRMAMTRTGEEKEKDGRPAWKTPFEEEAAQHGYRYLGGKVDDITVMTAVVSERL